MNWKEKQLLAENTLKQKYNSLLAKYYELDDNSSEIVHNPIFKKVNQGLIETAEQIAALRGFVVKGVELHSYFTTQELTKGFTIN